jgi:ribosome-binding factor A
VNEDTTSDALAFVPGVVGGAVPGQQDAEDIVDNDVDPLTIVNKKKKMKDMKEDVDRRAGLVKQEIVAELDDIVAGRKINDAEFISTFTVTKDLTQATVLITPFTTKSAPDKLMKQLPEDIGQLELILSALMDGGEIAQYDAFADVTALYGVRVQSVTNGTQLVYEGMVDRVGIESESILVDNQDVLDEVKSRFNGVKVVNKVLFPVSGVFVKGFMKKLKDIIEDVEDKKENDHEEAA